MVIFCLLNIIKLESSRQQHCDYWLASCIFWWPVLHPVVGWTRTTFHVLLSGSLSPGATLLVALAEASWSFPPLVDGAHILPATASAVFWNFQPRTQEHGGFPNNLPSLPVAVVFPRSNSPNLVRWSAVLLFSCNSHSLHNTLGFPLGLKTFRILNSS